MAEDISITYEKLFDLSRKEKSNEELQKLDKNFFDDLISYLNDKNSILDSSDDDTVFSRSEKEITEKQMENIKKLVNDIYMRREKKIMNLAIMKSRTNSSMIDTSSMLPEEKRLFEDMVSILKDYKKNVLFRILEGKKPEQPKGSSDRKIGGENSDKQDEKVKVEMTDNVPKFIGKEMETYGPFEQGATADLPEQVANILISKGRAKKIE